MKNQNSFIAIIGDQNIILNWNEKDIALLTLVGAALSESQSFEVAISFFLSSILAQNDTKLDYDNLMENHTSKTLGWLSDKLKKELGNEKISLAIDRAREKRNFLVHNILKKYKWPFMSEEDYLNCLLEINAIRRVISESKIEIGQVLKDEKILKLITLTDEDIDQLKSF
ncbi:MAG: hypothetical protein JNK77_02680 [Saprospiraceae bacterium]|nr:hypothetical protein [Saprospiraceae bacterium]